MTTPEITTPPDDPDRTWSHCLASGAPGIALLHIERAHTGTGAWHTAHRWAAAMTRHPVNAHPHASSLYHGAPAVAFALHTASQPGYTPALDALDRNIATATEARLHAAHERIDRQDLPTLGEFDLIRGLTGLGAYLLHRHRRDDLLRDILHYLVRLTEPITTHGQKLPGWWTHNRPADQPSATWPGGHGNLGMAHGIAGPLALLSTAMTRGVTVPGHTDAIDRICGWLDTWRCGTRSQPWWPGVISLAEWRAGGLNDCPAPGRPSWCYGTPGVARAQQLAAIALGDPQRQQDAEAALTACLADQRQLSQITDASVCHGWAGLALTTWRAAADSIDGNAGLTAQVSRLLAQLKKHKPRHGPPNKEGLLEGPAGVLLAEHTMASKPPPAPRWDVCLLIGG